MNNFKRKPFSHSGVAMLEFAFILPLLLMILFGITELGRALYQQNTLYKTVSTGSRYMARAGNILNPPACDETDPETAAAWTAAHDIAQNLIIYGATTAGTTPLIPNLDAESAITIEPVSVKLTKTPVEGEYVEEWVCKITIAAEAEFAGLFGDIVIPFTDIEKFMIRAETEDRYIGL